jgi:hypothetical protein
VTGLSFVDPRLRTAVLALGTALGTLVLLAGGAYATSALMDRGPPPRWPRFECSGLIARLSVSTVNRAAELHFRAAGRQAGAEPHRRIIDDIVDHQNEQQRRRYRHLYSDMNQEAMLAVFATQQRNALN